jgi:nucleoside-diphosphate-sugar epimerase
MAKIMQENFKALDIRYLPKDTLTPNRGTLSVEKARTLLGFNPENPLEKGYVEYIDWYKDFYSSYQNQ